MANQKLNFNLTFALSAVLLFGIVTFFNGVLGRIDLGRFDLTEDSIYTISDSAKRVLGELDVPVKIKLYITAKEDMPTGLQTLERDLVDKLAEFRAASKGNLSFAVYDPSKDDELAEKLASQGVRPFQVQSIERDAMGIKLVYSSIGILYKDKEEELLPQVLPQSLETLEYDLCSRITKLTRDEDPVVAIYASKQTVDPQMMQLYMQMGQQPPAPQDIYTQCQELLKREGYDVRPVEITEESQIPEDATTLLVLAPRNLNERQRYEINRFVQRGGNLIVATQRYEYNYNPGSRGGFNITPAEQTAGIEQLLESYGVSLSDRLLMDGNMEILSIPSTQNIGGFSVQMNQPVQAPMQIKVVGSQFNQDVSITSRMANILYLWGSRLEIDAEKLGDVEMTELFKTSELAWEVDYTAGPLVQANLQPDPTADVSGEPLAVMLNGDLPNPYAEGDVPAWAGAANDSVLAGPIESFPPANSKVVVVGCAKMFDDNLIGAASNGLFLLNAVDALSLGDDLIAMRAKAYTQRVIEPVSDQKKLFFRFFAIGLVPVLIALFGVMRTIKRRQESAIYWAAQRG
jgi:ABC-type uncharacterized transport system involved in gliding motility auxiliary subunit